MPQVFEQSLFLLQKAAAAAAVHSPLLPLSPRLIPAVRPPLLFFFLLLLLLLSPSRFRRKTFGGGGGGAGVSDNEEEEEERERRKKKSTPSYSAYFVVWEIKNQANTKFSLEISIVGCKKGVKEQKNICDYAGNKNLRF